MRYLLIIFLLTSCTASYHLNKFYKKGGKIDSTEVLLTVRDTVKGIDGKDSIIEKMIPANCPQPIAPKTRWMVRYETRQAKDSLRHDIKARKIDAKIKVVTIRHESKRSMMPYAIGVIIGLIGGVLISRQKR